MVKLPMGKVPEPIFLEAGFRFDQPSRELEEIKWALNRWLSTVLTPTETPTQDKVGERETLTCFLGKLGGGGKDYLSDLYGIHGETMNMSCGCVRELGTACSTAERIMDALAQSREVYLVPDEDDKGVPNGNFMLCALPPS
ncbi:MAG TPA: hypothetical protein VJJ02_04475 [Candidatus Paceibacterota bacterium]